MQIKDLTNNSSFTELSLDEAAKVNGGNGWYPRLFDDIFYESLGSDSITAYYLGQNPNRYRLRDPLANGVNSDSLGAFDRRLAGILAPLSQNGIRI